MNDTTPPPSDETAPIAGRRPPSGSAPDPAAAPTPPPSPPAADGAPLPPTPADPPPAAAYDVPPAHDPGQGRSWRDRLRRGTADGGSRTFGVGALVAGTLAGLIIGGVAGGAIGAAVSGDDHGPGDRFGHMERGIPGGPGDDDRGSFGQVPGQLPPGAVPAPPTDGDDDDAQPDDSSNS